MLAELSRAQCAGCACTFAHDVDTALVGGGEQIAAAIEVKTVVALAGEPLHDIDAAIGHRHHGVAGARPPVSITLCGFVAGERERRQLVDDDDIAYAPLHTQMIGGGDAGDTGAADDDFGVH